MHSEMFMLTILAAAAAAPTHQVSGVTRHHSRICGGGAAITPEMEAALPPPAPLANISLAIVSGRRARAGNPNATVVTDAQGRFKVRLHAGTWCIFEASRTPPPDAALPAAVSPNPYVDAQCLADYQRRCDAEVEVTRDISDVEVAFFDSCPQQYNQPCWRGPMPP